MPAKTRSQRGSRGSGRGSAESFTSPTASSNRRSSRSRVSVSEEKAEEEYPDFPADLDPRDIPDSPAMSPRHGSFDSTFTDNYDMYSEELNALKKELHDMTPKEAYRVLLEPEQETELVSCYEKRLARIIKFYAQHDDGNLMTARKLLDIPVKQTGSLLIAAVKDRKRNHIKILTGNDDTYSIKDKNGKKLGMSDPNIQGQLGRTALYEACRWGDVDVVRQVVKYCQGWEYPWQSEIGLGFVEVDPTIADREGVTPLMAAVHKRHIKVVKLLCDELEMASHPHMSATNKKKRHPKDQINKSDHKGSTALCYACKHADEQPDLVDCLLRANADVNQSEKNTAFSPLHYACKSGHSTIVEKLLERDANPNAKAKLYNRWDVTPLHLAVERDGGALTIVQMLVDGQADVLARDSEGNTALHKLFQKKRMLGLGRDNRDAVNLVDEIIKFILLKSPGGSEKGLRVKNNEGRTAFEVEDQELHYQLKKEEIFKRAKDDDTNITWTEWLFPWWAWFSHQAASDDSHTGDEVFDEILIQRSVNLQWQRNIQPKKTGSLCWYAVLVLMSTMVGVIRTGFEGEQFSYHSGVSNMILQAGPGCLESRSCKGCHTAECAGFESIQSLDEFLKFASDLSTDAWSDTGHDFISIGNPLLRQWRARLSENEEECKVSRKIKKVDQQPCLVDFDEEDRPPPQLDGVDVKNERIRDSVRRAFNQTDPRTHNMPPSSPEDDYETSNSSVISWRPLQDAFTSNVVMPALSLSVAWIIGLDSDIETDWKKYPPACYLTHVPISRLDEITEYRLDEGKIEPMTPPEALVGALNQVGWTDNKTRALAFEMALYSTDQDCFTLARLMIEMRGDAGPRLRHDIRTYRIHSWNFRPSGTRHVPSSANPLWFFIRPLITTHRDITLKVLEVVTALLMTIHIVDTFQKNRNTNKKRKTVFHRLWQAKEAFFFICLLIVEYCLYWDVNDVRWGPGVSLQNATTTDIVQQMMATEKLESVLLAQIRWGSSLVLLLWLDLFASYLVVFRDVTILLKAIGNMLADNSLCSFIVILVGLYIAFSTATFMLPGKQHERQNFFSTLVSEFEPSLKEGLNADQDRRDWIEHLMNTMFGLIVVALLMNILLTLLMDMYGKEKEKAAALWCREQVQMLAEKEEDEADPAEEERKSKQAKMNWHKAKKRVMGAIRMQNPSRTPKFEKLNELVEQLLERSPNGAQSKLWVEMPDEQFRQALESVSPELGFFLGDVKGPEGIMEEAGAAEGKKTSLAILALKNIVLEKRTKDFFTKDVDDSVSKSLYSYAMDKVGLRDPKILHAMFVCLLMSSIGKIVKWQEDVLSAIDTEDGAEEKRPTLHTRIVQQTLRNKVVTKRFLPSFELLDPIGKEIIQKGYDTDFILGQFGQLENTPANLLPLCKLAQRPLSDFDPDGDGTRLSGSKIMHFWLFSQVLAIAGSMGGKLPSFLWMNFKTAIDNLTDLGQELDDAAAVGSHGLSAAASPVGPRCIEDLAVQVYEKFLLSQEEKLKIRSTLEKEFGDSNDEQVKSMARLARMCRFSKPEDVPDLVRAFKKLKAEVRERLVSELNKTGVKGHGPSEGWAILLQYSPTILQNAVGDKTYKTKVERLVFALNTLHDIFQFSRERQVKEWNQDRACPPNGVYEVNCFEISNWSKSIKQLEDSLKKGSGSSRRQLYVDHQRLQGNRGEADCILQSV